jgi:Flp pilus assembly protein TadG
LPIPLFKIESSTGRHHCTVRRFFLTDIKGPIAQELIRIFNSLNRLRLSTRGRNMSTRIVALTRRLQQSRSGSVAIQMGLAMIVILGMVGLGTEMTFVYAKHRQLQMFADAAAYNAAIAERNGYPNRELEAQSVVTELANSNISNYANDINVVVNTPSPGAVEAVVSQPQTLSIINLVCTWYGGCPNIVAGLFTVGARAVAVITASGSYCVLALNGTASGAVTTQGTAVANLTRCSLAVASNSPSSIRVSGGGTINAEKVATLGGVDLSGGGTINASDGIVENSTERFNDPYAIYPVPQATSSCSKTNYKLTAGSSPPPFEGGCTFSGGIELASKSSLTLKRGVYVINNGPLKIGGGAQLMGEDVTIVLTGNATVDIAGGSIVDIKAAETGPTAGIAIFGKSSGSSKFLGGASQTIIGAVYLPNQAVTYAGGNELAATKCMQLIANTITFTGNSNFSLDCTGIPIGNIGGNLVKLVQ